MKRYYYLKTISYMLLALTLLDTSPALAASDVWSFVDNPHPGADDLMAEEKAYLERRPGADPDATPCENLIVAEYEIYLRRYPDFEKTGTPDENFRKWKVHLSHDTPGYFSACLSITPSDRLRDANPAPSDFYFCGRYSRPPATAEERRYARWIDELFVYAQSASEPSVNFLLSVDKNTSIVDLAPPVEYYFAKLVKPYLKDEVPPRDVDHLLPGFTAKQKAFLDEAVETRDLKAVLEMAGACEPR